MTASPAPVRAYHRIVAQLRSDIFAGRRQPGERLPPEPALAAQFGVSRAGVREALRVLELQGLVQVRHGHAGGVFVTEPTCAPVVGALEDLLRRGHLDPRELYEARQAVEPAIVRLAVERDAPALAAALADNVARSAAALAAGEGGSALNREFHRLVAERAGNSVLALVMHVLQELLEQHDQRRPPVRALSRCALADHRRLLAAVQAGDAARAEQLMREHLARLAGRLHRPAPRRMGTMPARSTPGPAAPAASCRPAGHREESRTP